MKYHVRLSTQMRKIQIALMLCVFLAGLACFVYGYLAVQAGSWKSWKHAGPVFALAVLIIAGKIIWNGYCEVTTRIIVYPGRKIIVHKGRSVKTYTFDQLKKPKPAKKNPRIDDSEEANDEYTDQYGYSMVLRQKNGREIVKLSTSYKHVRRLEEDILAYYETCQ